MLSEVKFNSLQTPDLAAVCDALLYVVAFSRVDKYILSELMHYSYYVLCGCVLNVETLKSVSQKHLFFNFLHKATDVFKGSL